MPVELIGSRRRSPLLGAEAGGWVSLDSPPPTLQPALTDPWLMLFHTSNSSTSGTLVMQSTYAPPGPSNSFFVFCPVDR